MTIHERVHEAGLAAAERASGLASGQQRSGADHAREEMYNVVRDPTSSWPEPAMEGEALAEAMRGWLPKGTPLSPSRKAQGVKLVHKTSPRKGSRTDNSQDAVAGVNQAVGEFNTTVGGHGGRMYASGVPSSSHPSS